MRGPENSAGTQSLETDTAERALAPGPALAWGCHGFEWLLGWEGLKGKEGPPGRVMSTRGFPFLTPRPWTGLPETIP